MFHIMGLQRVRNADIIGGCKLVDSQAQRPLWPQDSQPWR